MSDALDALRGRGSERRDDTSPVTGQVVLVDPAGGIHVAPLDEDTAHPVGPCRGPAVEKGDIVLVIFTDHGPWVAQVHHGGEV